MREKWNGRVVFLFASVAAAFTFGNIWGMPHFMSNGGGGAFLIPYTVALLTAGIPFLMLEMVLGQKFKGAPPIVMQKINARFEAVGWWAVLSGLAILTYISVVLAWSLRYIWSSVRLEWGSEAHSFFYDKILELSPILEEGAEGAFRGITLLNLVPYVLVWAGIFIITYYGIKAISKVVMVTLPLSLILLMVFAARSFSLPGAISGLPSFLNPDYSMLFDIRVWLAAYGQIFLSLSLAAGIFITYSSYMPDKTDITNNSFIIGLADTLIAFISGIAVYSIIGHISQTLNMPIQDIVSSGVGLVFVTFPNAVNLFPSAPVFFALIFFISLFLLGLDFSFSLAENTVRAVMDKWQIERLYASIIVSGTSFSLGLFFLSRGGLLWLDTVNNFIMNFALTFTALIICILVGWVYGLDEIREHIWLASEYSLGKWFDICIKYIIPIILFLLLIPNLILVLIQGYEGYPSRMINFGGWILLIIIFISGIVLMLTGSGERVKEGEES